MALPVKEAETAASVEEPPRECTIEIENNCSDMLMNPRTYLCSGFCDKPLPVTIGVSSSGSGVFVKTAGTARGAVGVFTYDLYKSSTNQNKGKMAIMFSNPFDFNLYSNWFAVGVFDMNKQCNRDLYYEMYNGEETGFVRGKAKDGCLTFTSHGVTIRATMSDTYKPVINVKVTDR